MTAAAILAEAGSIKRINLAVLALGGQGGGVLADWILKVAEANGYRAQGTSIAGVAQRTGATIYYIELASNLIGEPVLALSPTPGDVDIVIASELMEAGRGMVRGLVTKDRTTLISSTHRIFAIAEKSKMGGPLDRGDAVLQAASERSRLFIGFDMESAALGAGSVISAPMFGALAASEALPFARSDFEDVIRAGGMAVEANLRGFLAGWDGVRLPSPAMALTADVAPSPTTPVGEALYLRITTELPANAHGFAVHGARRLLDYQDQAYAELYLDRLHRLAKSVDAGDRSGVIAEAARRLALWMSYEDVIRVADLKTRKARVGRVEGEVGAEPGQIVDVVEFMHPRLEELCDILPRRLGAGILRRSGLRKGLDPLFRKGRFVATTSVRGFLLLYALAALRPLRKRSLRFFIEQERIELWLERAATAATTDPKVALELILCQTLLKGYGDTFERGLINFNRIMQVYSRLATDCTSSTLAELRSAALADEEGSALTLALQTAGFSI